MLGLGFKRFCLGTITTNADKISEAPLVDDYTEEHYDHSLAVIRKELFTIERNGTPKQALMAIKQLQKILL